MTDILLKNIHLKTENIVHEFQRYKKKCKSKLKLKIKPGLLFLFHLPFDSYELILLY